MVVRDFSYVFKTLFKESSCHSHAFVSQTFDVHSHGRTYLVDFDKTPFFIQRGYLFLFKMPEWGTLRSTNYDFCYIIFEGEFEPISGTSTFQKSG